MNSTKALKNSLRAEALSRRDALDLQWRIEASLAMVNHVGALKAQPGDVVSGFWPMRSEVDIRPLLSALRERGARLALPAIIDKTTIVFRELVRGAEMIDMGFGTVGPAADAEVLEPDLMLMPLAAFDDDGNRIGYGGGYYDRAIARLHAKGREPRLVGIAFECQRVDAVPAEDHDVPLPAILTEDGLHPLPRRR